MKKILILFMLIQSMNLLAQKPNNRFCGFLLYGDDYSINLMSFNDEYVIPKNKFSELLKIIEKAEKLHNYCIQKGVEYEISIDTIIVDNINYLFIFSGNKHDSKINIKYSYFNKKFDGNLLGILPTNDSYVYDFTIARDKYYRDLADYNDRLKQANNDINKILNEK